MSKSRTEKAIVDVVINGETANKSIRDLEAAARKAKAELRGMTPDNKEYQKYKQSLEQINKELEKSKVNAGLAASAWSKMKQEIKTTFLGNLGANLATLGLQKFADYFTDAWDAAKKLSDQLADVRKTTGMTAAEVANLRKELMQINTRTSMSDLMEIAKVGGQFGVAKDQILGFVEAVDKTTVALGDEFGGGAEEVAATMSKLRNTFADIKSDNIGEDINYISNAINELAASGVATGPVVSDFANRIGGVGIPLGLTTSEVLGLSATLQELGVTAERGGTAVTKILQKMLNDTGSFAEIAGMNVADFETLLNQDLFGAFKKVIEGSRTLGSNSTTLASIIKDLEVNGAGASEVFAKLGTNMDMLEEKTTLANNALSNTASISEEFRLRNENFAGSVEALNKEWNRLTSNPAIMSWFKAIIDLSRGALKAIGEISLVLKDVFSVGGEEALKNQKMRRAMEEEGKAAEELKQMYNDQVQAYKLSLQKMDVEQLRHEEAKKKVQLKSQIDKLKELLKTGDMENYYIQKAQAEALQAELQHTRKVIDEKSKRGDTKIRLTDDEIKAQKKQAEQALKALKKEHDDWFAATMRHYDQLIAETQRKVNKDLELFLKAEQEKTAKQKDFYDKELFALLDYNVAKATTDDETYLAEKERLQVQYMEKKNVVKEGSYQYLLLEQELSNKLKQLDTDRAQSRLAKLQEYGSMVSSTLQTVQQFHMAQYDTDMNSFRRYTNSKKTMLKQQLDKGLIDTSAYNAEIAKLDADQDEREREMRVKQARTQKAYAVFESAIKVALAWVEAYTNPAKIPGAIAASAQAALIAAMPVPEFYEGGFMPRSSNDKDAFPIIAHANEYMVNAKSMRDPFVMNTVQVIESAKQKGVTPSEVARQSDGEGSQAELLAAAQRLESAANQLSGVLSGGIKAILCVGEKELIEMERLNKILIDRGDPGLGNSIADDLIEGTNNGLLNRASSKKLV